MVLHRRLYLVVGRLDTQLGSWLCQHQVVAADPHAVRLANDTTWSPGPKLNEPRDASVVSHFISLPGVTMSNWGRRGS